jgi:hypothetical protein
MVKSHFLAFVVERMVTCAAFLYTLYGAEESNSCKFDLPDHFGGDIYFVSNLKRL